MIELKNGDTFSISGLCFDDKNRLVLDDVVFNSDNCEESKGVRHAVFVVKNTLESHKMHDER